MASPRGISIRSSSSASRRPKLALQTAFQDAPTDQNAKSAVYLPLEKSSPTSRNAQSNIVEPQLSVMDAQSISSPPISKLKVRCQESLSPLALPFDLEIDSRKVPYTLAHGTCSILRNSPVPFQPDLPLLNSGIERIRSQPKKVLFSDSLVELMPTPVVDASDSDPELKPTVEEAVSKRKQKNGGAPSRYGNIISSNIPPPSPLKKRRKRKEWTWTIEQGDEKDPGLGSRPFFNEGVGVRPRNKIRYPKTPIPGKPEQSLSSGSASASDSE